MRRVHIHRKRDAMMAAAGLIAMLAFVGSLAALAAQAPTGQGGSAAGVPQTTEKKQFEVASVKPNKSGENRVMLGLQPGGRFTATNVPLRNLITNAYRIQGSQLVGGPGWVGSDRFDIAAKAEGNPAPEDINLMVQSLLADRFGLVVHRETREMPIYALLLARPDGKLGDKLKPSDVDCEAVLGRGRGRGAVMPPPPTPGAPMTCGMRIGPGILSAGSSTMAQLAQSLGINVGRIVQDNTGLTGRYDIDLSWTPEGRGGGPFGGPGGAPSPTPSDGTGVSIFTAVQEQLGLKLDAQRGQVEVLVVDQVAQPTPD